MDLRRPGCSRPSAAASNFLTLAECRSLLAGLPDWSARGDLQMHTRWSDGSDEIEDMVSAARERGYEYIAIEPEALERLDLVLGCFHSKLRLKDDQTARYLAALRNPHVHILGHPRGRVYNFRLGLQADWETVFREAAELDKAVEIDCFPDRQDLDVQTLQLARQAGVRISLGTDAHASWQLFFLEFGLAAAWQAGIPRERILNFMSADELQQWAAQLWARNGRP